MGKLRQGITTSTAASPKSAGLIKVTKTLKDSWTKTIKLLYEKVLNLTCTIDFIIKTGREEKQHK